MRTAEQILDEHCTTTYNKHNGEEEIESSKSAVVIAMEEYAEQKCKQLHIADVSIALSGFMDWLWLNHNILTNADNNKIALEKYLATL